MGGSLYILSHAHVTFEFKFCLGLPDLEWFTWLHVLGNLHYIILLLSHPLHMSDEMFFCNQF